MPKKNVKLSEANKAKNVEDEALSDDLQLDEDDPCEPPKSKGKKARQDSDELDLVSVVQEYQRQRNSKAKTRNAAFLKKKEGLFTAARAEAAVAAHDGCAYMDAALQRISELRQQDAIPQSRDRLDKLVQTLNEDQGKFNSWVSNCELTLEHMMKKRGELIDDASYALELHTSARNESLADIRQIAKNYVLEGQRNKTLATDASAYIKHFKAMLYSS